MHILSFLIVILCVGYSLQDTPSISIEPINDITTDPTSLRVSIIGEITPKTSYAILLHDSEQRRFTTHDDIVSTRPYDTELWCPLTVQEQPLSLFILSPEQPPIQIATPFAHWTVVYDQPSDGMFTASIILTASILHMASMPEILPEGASALAAVTGGAAMFYVAVCTSPSLVFEHGYESIASIYSNATYTVQAVDRVIVSHRYRLEHTEETITLESKNDTYHYINVKARVLHPVVVYPSTTSPETVISYLIQVTTRRVFHTYDDYLIALLYPRAFPVFPEQQTDGPSKLMYDQIPCMDQNPLDPFVCIQIIPLLAKISGKQLQHEDTLLLTYPWASPYQQQIALHYIVPLALSEDYILPVYTAFFSNAIDTMVPYEHTVILPSGEQVPVANHGISLIGQQVCIDASLAAPHCISSKMVLDKVTIAPLNHSTTQLIDYINHRLQPFKDKLFPAITTTIGPFVDITKELTPDEHVTTFNGHQYHHHTIRSALITQSHGSTLPLVADTWHILRDRNFKPYTTNATHLYDEVTLPIHTNYYDHSAATHHHYTSPHICFTPTSIASSVIALDWSVASNKHPGSSHTDRIERCLSSGNDTSLCKGTMYITLSTLCSTSLFDNVYWGCDASKYI